VSAQGRFVGLPAGDLRGAPRPCGFLLPGGGYDTPKVGGGGDMLDNTYTVILLMLIAILYMLPTVIAYGRDIPQRRKITVINILFGWTLIAWVIIFLWAMSAETQQDELA
jgi:hypothetical protein